MPLPHYKKIIPDILLSFQAWIARKLKCLCYCLWVYYMKTLLNPIILLQIYKDYRNLAHFKY